MNNIPTGGKHSPDRPQLVDHGLRILRERGGSNDPQPAVGKSNYSGPTTDWDESILRERLGERPDVFGNLSMRLSTR